MNKFPARLFSVVAATTLLLWQTPVAVAQHGHGHHGGHGHFGGHIGGGHYGGHDHHGGHGFGHSFGHVDVHIGRHFVVPHYDRHHHGSYWVDSGAYYYQPRTYAVTPNTHVVAKPIAIEFGGFSQVDDLSGRLERLANELCLDLHYNYAHNPGFNETYREAYQILDAAKSMHVKEHQDDREEIARQVQALDPLFHHVQGEVRGWSRKHQKQIGQAGIVTKIDSMEALLHHLMNDIGVKPHDGDATESAPAPQSEEVAPPPPPPAAVNVPPPPTVP
ncbi:hypothetical protein [Aeoliella sp.]|uniref:hypothetical protein n=1 Tax=Aeoliella sp. TaxID=2795800 RepID=UPI003CCBDA1C